MTTDTSMTGRESDKFMLRLPEGMREQIKSAAFAHRRTMNSEVVQRLTQSFQTAESTLPLPTEVTLAVEREMNARGGTFNEALTRLVSAGEQQKGLVLNLSVQKGMSVQELSKMVQRMAEALPENTEVIIRHPV